MLPNALPLFVRQPKSFLIYSGSTAVGDFEIGSSQSAPSNEGFQRSVQNIQILALDRLGQFAIRHVLSAIGVANQNKIGTQCPSMFRFRYFNRQCAPPNWNRNAYYASALGRFQRDTKAVLARITTRPHKTVKSPGNRPGLKRVAILSIWGYRLGAVLLKAVTERKLTTGEMKCVAKR